MKIGELSRRTGTSVRMLRYYEAEGLLAPMRMENGYRDYGPMEEEIVRRIQLLGSAGLTLPTIHRFLPCVRGVRHKAGARFTFSRMDHEHYAA